MIYDRISQFMHSMKDFAKSGFEVAKPEEFQKRLTTCSNCEHYNNGMCDVCGCVIILKAKIGCEECPIKKWTKTEDCEKFLEDEKKNKPKIPVFNPNPNIPPYKCGGCGK